MTGKQTRCRMHGGASTGPRTREGKERCRKANLQHGKRSQQYLESRRQFRRLLGAIRQESEAIERDIRKLLREVDADQFESTEENPCIT